jgi:hypothetical protein
VDNSSATSIPGAVDVKNAASLFACLVTLSRLIGPLENLRSQLHGLPLPLLSAAAAGGLVASVARWFRHDLSRTVVVKEKNHEIDGIAQKGVAVEGKIIGHKYCTMCGGREDRQQDREGPGSRMVVQPGTVRHVVPSPWVLCYMSIEQRP